MIEGKYQLAPTEEGVATLEKIKEELVQTVGEVFEDMREKPRELSVTLNTEAQ